MTSAIMLRLGALGAGWTSYFLIWGLWDTATTAVMVGIALGIATIWATAVPRLTKASVDAENMRRDAAVNAAVLWWKTQAEKLEAVERDLRLEVHKLEAQIQLEVSRSSRYRTLWEMATGQPISPKSADIIPVAPGPDPPSIPPPSPNTGPARGKDAPP